MKSKTTTLLGNVGAILLASACLLTACADSPTEAIRPGEPGPRMAKGGKGNPGGFDDTTIPVTLHTFAGDMTGSTDPLKNGFGSVQALISPFNGQPRLYLDTFTGNPKRDPIEARLCLDLPSASVEPGADDHWADFESAVGSPVGVVCSAGLFRTTRHSNDGALTAMLVTHFATAGATFFMDEHLVSEKGLEWRVYFHEYSTRNDPVQTGVCIEREPEDRWRIFMAACPLAGVDETVQLIRRQKSVGDQIVAEIDLSASFVIETLP
jgi:hypothetical protein